MMNRLILSLLLASTPAALAADSLEQILAGIQTLESDKDPKCYATASRLEDFMYGTPLTDEARFQKNRLQKRLAEVVWRAAEQREQLEAGDIDAAFSEIIKFGVDKYGSNRLAFPSGSTVMLKLVDSRQYGSIAYSLRAILAVQQESMMNPDLPPLPQLSEDALEMFKNRLDLATLALLQEADAYARAHDEYEITLDNINRSWVALYKKAEKPGPAENTVDPVLTDSPPPLLKKTIQQKIASYAAYNQISNQLFVRNMQVYFARLSWPADKEESEAFRLGFVEALVGYAIELYKGVTQLSFENGHALISEEDVSRFIQKFTPFEVNEYEDVTYFPGLPAASVTIESFDLDAFRDSGVHWLYLGHALDSAEVTAYLDADPFAAELLAESVAQFGVLLLREAGLEGRKRGEERLSLELLKAAVNNIQGKVSATLAGVAENPVPAQSIRSSEHENSTDPGDGQRWFVDKSAEAGIDHVHRSSDWLNRLLRSYLRRDENTGIITIPPAFGGSGVAAGDIDGDGHTDLLLLSGSGNTLYRNDGSGGFVDITEKSGIRFRRPEDRHPGEPRQALLADLDNDGRQDIVITYVDDDHRVYRNRGDGTFEDLTKRAGLGGKGLVGGPATVFDYDNDGLLDLYIMYFGDYIHGVLPTLKRFNDNGLPNKLFRNEGDFRFSEVSAGVADSGWGQAVAHTDFDLDNRQDLIVGNDFGTNVYYRNKGDGTFEDVTQKLGTGKPSYTMNVGLADLNDDLAPDVYISNIVTMNKDEKYVLPNEDTQMKFNLEKLANLRVVEANDLFLSSRGLDGKVTYMLNRDLVGRGYNATGWSWGASFFDADLDGDDDLYVLNGMNEYNLYSSKNAYADPGAAGQGDHYLPVDTRESNVFFLNSNGRLHNASQPSGLDLLGNSRSAAYLDYDRDGDLDIVLNNYHAPARLFENRAEHLGGNWIRLELDGDPDQGSNRDAIGAKVVFELPGNRIWREIRGSEAYLTVHERAVHAGLGGQESVDVTVVWPNGQIQRVENLAANKTHRIKMKPVSSD